ncbi:LysR family transcriptional regulator, hydrogen peroxide-inducible genes activator [Arenibacter palladensis]|uniref:LysR family transcriptional regulator, hydrogen peroxide-inducible genes activator n=2 Tax=Arenibacter TaxID=178469 RepID=A0A1X7ISS3_9FLAO|nr:MULTISPECIES: LysR substrate-binding domain-containing protein [Arenibacter]MDO6602407.1 LysR substrate-binding domain-containing protein [Arenibacter palladensis]SHF28417.1 LysR family transcriptional regulator, hydrogen peroxide-inducible genes activator [Arenibacter palladensis]SMG17852.1 LysR family transcriptional regulator, hydrogen peroxide-inducible genes activator [Arenibacter troitsensis]|tara:strand:- start:11807 stop:12745 length:939 start_codon:yes stop_codon:yes gene_type:complete
MTITQLQYVLAVAEYQNFTLAAEKSFVTQPTLSMQVQKLEDELDILIFDRGKKPITITEVGAKIVAQAKNIVNEANRIKDIVDQEKGFIGGEFTLGIIPTIMPTLLPMFLRTFIKKYPKVNLIIKEQNTENLIRNLQDGHIDAAIAATPLEIEFIKERPLYYEPFVGYVPPNHRLGQTSELVPEDLEISDVLLLRDGHCFRDGVINLCNASKNYQEEHFQLQSGSFETLINLSNEGLGMTLLPFLNTIELDDKKKQNLKFFKNPSPAREVSLIYHKSELKIQITEALYDVIASVVRGAIAFQDVKIISPLNK